MAARCRRGLSEKDSQMGEFNKDQGQANQGDQTSQTGRTDTSAFDQFDKGENRQDQSERGQQDREDFADAGANFESSSAREGEISNQDKAGQQGGFGTQQGQQGWK